MFNYTMMEQARQSLQAQLGELRILDRCVVSMRMVAQYLKTENSIGLPQSEWLEAADAATWNPMHLQVVEEVCLIETTSDWSGFLEITISDRRLRTAMNIFGLVFGFMILLGGILILWFQRERRRRIDSRDMPIRFLEESKLGPKLLRSLDRSESMDFLSTSMRKRSGSYEAFSSQFTRTLSTDSMAGRRVADSGEADTLNQSRQDEANVIYYGPKKSVLEYTTWIPPPSWKDASRKMLPHFKRQLNRTLLLDLSQQKPYLEIRNDDHQNPNAPSKPERMPISDVSIHVKSPAEGGVLQLYSTAMEEPWREHTFVSAGLAAQFQSDILAYNILGPQIVRMYKALELVHQGNCKGQEMVLHRNRFPEDECSPTEPGVAWDDSMRALNSIPSIRLALETLQIHYRYQEPKANGNSIAPPSAPEKGASNTPGGGDAPAETADAQDNKRLVLGLIDFFRLFVPFVPPRARPRAETSRNRMEQLLRWRKRAARSALLVRAYVKARTVVNLGWHLKGPKPSNYITRRFAYDDPTDNNIRDCASSNEYYEGTVSRDILCRVRSDRNPSGGGVGVFSGYQAYSLVGIHMFEMPDKGTDHPLSPEKDPVLAIPSLREIIECHPDLDFFVEALFLDVQKAITIRLYVRSLPKGVDPKFDMALDRYVYGTKEIRDRKLSWMIQIGPIPGLSFQGWLVLQMLKFVLNSLRTGREIPQEPSSDRTPLPAVAVKHFGELHHFGGSLAVPDSPTNYVAVAECINFRTRYHSCFLPRLIQAIPFYQLESRSFTSIIADFTLILGGESQDELPERALATCRLVRPNPHVNIPISSTTLPQEVDDDFDFPSVDNLPSENGIAVIEGSSLVERTRTTGPTADVSPSAEDVLRYDSLRSLESNPWLSAPSTEDFRSVIESQMESLDPLDRAVDELIAILRDIRVPVWKEQLSCDIDNDANADAVAGQQLAGCKNVPVVQLVTRRDIRRYCMAASGKLSEAASRIVASAGWRGLTFPIDLRMCRVELHTGQCFQQGKDKEGNPIFYFRNLCLGPWRADVVASRNAILHRLETSLGRLAAHNPDVQCTLIVMMGRPYRPSKRKGKKEEEKKSSESETDDAAGDGEAAEDENEDEESEVVNQSARSNIEETTKNYKSNPRVPEDESWYVHTNIDLLHEMIYLLSLHYPERLRRALVVLGKKNHSYFRTTLGGRLAFPKTIPIGEERFKIPTKTRSKIRFVSKYTDLLNFVEMDELVTIAGGTAPIDPSAFECRQG